MSQTAKRPMPNARIAGMSSSERRDEMARIGSISGRDRVILNRDEAEALGEAYRLLDRIYQRHQKKLDKASSIEGEGRADAG